MLRRAGRTRPPASRDREPSIGSGVTPLLRASRASENTASAGGAIAAPRNNTTLEATPDGSAPELQDATGSGAGSCEWSTGIPTCSGRRCYRAATGGDSPCGPDTPNAVRHAPGCDRRSSAQIIRSGS
jgi:hypothetical protein